jgi:succinate dehydrogenase / fumarate reductase, iron-sulfur subunit
MTDQRSRPDAQGRRGFLGRIIQTVHLTMGATLAFVLGRAVLSPAFAKREALWLHAGDLNALADGEPVPVTLRIARPDGASEVVDRRVIYLVKTGERDVRALDSTCTHLGCRTKFNPETKHIECPCHGGVYDPQGQVVAGPPPAPLATLSTRLEGTQILVEV